MAQNLNLRKVIEDLSSKKVVKETRKLLKSQRNATVASGNPSNQELWSAVFKKEESKDVFPNLHALINEDVPVASIMADLIRFASKEVHTGEVERVFIDSRSLTSEQVNILSTITVLTSNIQLMFWCLFSVKWLELCARNTLCYSWNRQWIDCMICYWSLMTIWQMNCRYLFIQLAIISWVASSSSNIYSYIDIVCNSMVILEWYHSFISL